MRFCSDSGMLFQFMTPRNTTHYVEWYLGNRRCIRLQQESFSMHQSRTLLVNLRGVTTCLSSNLQAGAHVAGKLVHSTLMLTLNNAISINAESFIPYSICISCNVIQSTPIFPDIVAALNTENRSRYHLVPAIMVSQCAETAIAILFGVARSYSPDIILPDTDASLPVRTCSLGSFRSSYRSTASDV